MDADLISRSALMEKLFKKQQPQEGYLDMPEWESDKFRLWRNGVGSAIQITESAPAVDAVEVVRCEKCKHNVANHARDPLDTTDYSGKDIVCVFWLSDGLEPDDYCSRGERKGGSL